MTRPPPSPPPFRRPARRPLSVGLATLLLGTAAYAAPARAETDPSRPLTTEQLKKALVTTADLPAGYTAEPESTGSDGSGDAGDVEFSGCAALESREDTTLPAYAEASFDKAENAKGGTVSFILEILESGEEKKVRDAVTEIKDMPAKCPDFTMKIGGESVPIKASALSFTTLGDETHAVRLAFRVDGSEVPMTLVVVRRGATMITLMNAVIPGVPEHQLIETVARKTLDKLQHV